MEKLPQKNAKIARIESAQEAIAPLIFVLFVLFRSDICRILCQLRFHPAGAIQRESKSLPVLLVPNTVGLEQQSQTFPPRRLTQVVDVSGNIDQLGPWQISQVLDERFDNGHKQSITGLGKKSSG
jgi:hypothetical protein